MVPMGVMFIRTPIYTRIFSPSEYGEYTMVYVVNTYISVFAFQWIINNIWRFYLNYKNSGQYIHFKQSVFLLFITTSLFSFLIIAIWILVEDSLGYKILIFSGFIFIVTESLFAILTVPCRINGHSAKFNLLQSIRIIISFLLLLILTFISDFRIEAFFISPVIINIIFISFLLLNVDIKRLANIKINSLAPHLKRFYRYGYAMAIFNALSLFLVAGDRFLINWFNGTTSLGIYNQTYNIAQLTITALYGVFNAAINPFVLPLLENKDSRANTIIIKMFYISLLLLLPIVIVLSLFSKEISFVLLGSEFREMWEYLPFVFFGSFFLGASHFAIIKLKFLMRTRLLNNVAFTVFIFNLISNIIFIPLFGYKTATVTTLVSYLIQFIILIKYSDINIFSLENRKGVYVTLTISVLLICGFFMLFLFNDTFSFKFGFILEIIVLLIIGLSINARKIYLLWQS